MATTASLASGAPIQSPPRELLGYALAAALLSACLFGACLCAVCVGVFALVVGSSDAKREIVYEVLGVGDGASRRTSAGRTARLSGDSASDSE
jgi:hypothetical protein